MKLLRLIGNVIGIFFGAIIGNVIGDQIRAKMTQTAPKVQVSHYDEETKDTTIAVQPFISNVIPAILAGIILKPHWFWAMVGGGLAAGLMSDKYEPQFKEMIKNIQARIEEKEAEAEEASEEA